MSIETLACALSEAFEGGTRDNGDKFRKLRQGSPEWMTDAIHEAHADMMPDDWRYACIEAAAYAIAAGETGAGDFADAQVDPYNGARVAWLASHSYRADYCDEAAVFLGGEGSIMDRIGWGQYREASEIFDLLYSFLSDLADEEPDE